MATTLFFRTSSTVPAEVTLGSNDTNLAGSATGWAHLGLSTTQGASSFSGTAASATGPTNGVEVGGMAWISPALDADVTISGTVTFNLRMAESMTGANGGAQCVIERIDSTGTIQGTVVNSEKGTELGTAEAAQNWTAAPTSTNFLKGDRIRIRPAFNDAGGTMASGFTLTFWYSGAAGASGDSFVTFTETFGFLTAPAGTVIYPTDTASDVATAAVDREAWTARGSGVVNDVTNTVNGFTAPIQVTDTAGGTVVDWWTKQLAAFTLGGRVDVNERASLSNTGASGTRVEIAICAADGTGCTTWAGANSTSSHATTENVKTIILAGDDTAVSDGQRLRIRWLIDDGAGSTAEGTAVTAMTTANTVTIYYAGTSGGASGDTFLTFTQTLTQFTADTRVPYATPYPQLLAH